MAPETDHDNEARSAVVAIALTLPDEDAADLMVQHMNEGENLQPSREINARRAGVVSTMTSMAVHAGNDLVSILIPHFDSNCSDLLSNATHNSSELTNMPTCLFNRIRQVPLRQRHRFCWISRACDHAHDINRSRSTIGSVRPAIDFG